MSKISNEKKDELRKVPRVPKKNFSVRFDEKLFNKFRKHLSKENILISDFFNEVIKQELEGE